MSTLDLEPILTGKIPELSPLVKDVFYQNQIIIIAGEPGVGKSFLSYTLAMSVAGKRKFLGLETAHGPVLYFDEENGLGDLQRYLQWAWYGLNKPDLSLLQDNLRIEHFSLVKHGAKRYKYMGDIAGALKPALIVIDTASPACQIMDENDNAEASQAIKQLRLVKEVAGPQCCMIVLKHSRLPHDKQTERTIRGAKTWLGELDGVIYHVGVKGAPRKDGLKDSSLIPGKVRAFGLRDTLKIRPDWTTENNENRGLILGLK